MLAEVFKEIYSQTNSRLFCLQVFYKILDVPDVHRVWEGDVVWTEM